jgi:hypothetical protein
MHGKTLPSLLLTALLCVIVISPGLADETTQPTNTDVIQQHIHLQGRMLLSYLRRAREAGLSGDPWGMDFAVQEASRLVRGLRLAYRRLQGSAQVPKAGASKKAGPRQFDVPLEEGLDIDTSLPDGPWQLVDGSAQQAGVIPLDQVSAKLAKAYRLLQARPPALGAALIAVNQALGQIRWQQGLEPLPWVKARDQLLKAYTMTLDAHPEARAELANARDMLAALPDGKGYARYLTDLLNNPAPDRWALRGVLRQVDNQIELLRNTAEQSRFGKMEGRSRRP